MTRPKYIAVNGKPVRIPRKANKWADFDNVEGAIGHKAKTSAAKPKKASEPERDIQARAEALCDTLGIRWFRVPDSLLAALKNNPSIPMWCRAMVARYFKGVPDLMLFKKSEGGDNLTRFIEIKTEVGKVTQGQEHWHRGLNVRVTYGWEETEKAIKEFAQ